MHRRNLKHIQINGVWDLAKKVDALHVEPVSHLGKQHLPISAARSRRIAVTEVVASQNQGMGPRTPAQNLRKCPHEDMEAPVRLQVAGNVCDDFILAS